MDRIDLEASQIRDLWNKAVGTYPVFQHVLESSYHLSTVPIAAVGNGVQAASWQVHAFWPTARHVTTGTAGGGYRVRAPWQI